MRPTLLLAVVLLLGACGGDESATPAADVVLRRATTWLWAQQGEDGGWHSETYGLLRSGQSLTPFVLDALLDAERVVAPKAAALRSGIDFLVRHVGPGGALGLEGSITADYPTYATALGLIVLRRSGGHDALLRRMERWLLGQQLTEQNGWSREHPAYGAWGMGGSPVTSPNPGHIDLSMTRYALEAFVFAPPSPALSKARAAAQVFLGRLRASDGGYFFSTVSTDKNKAGRGADGSHLSYGTTTADALYVWHMCSGQKPLESMAPTVELLARRHRTDVVPGLASGPGADWGASMRHYYLAGSAAAFSLWRIDEAPVGRDWRRDLVVALGGEQRADGSFASDSGLMKEDDPLVATTLAIKALAAARLRP